MFAKGKLSLPGVLVNSIAVGHSLGGRTNSGIGIDCELADLPDSPGLRVP